MEGHTPQDFIGYPINRVVGTIAEETSARSAVEALIRAAFARDDIDVLHGERALHRLDPDGRHHGPLARFERSVMRTVGVNEESQQLDRHVEDVLAGRFVIMVRASEQDRRDLAASILKSHRAEFVGFFGRWAWQSMEDEHLTRPGPRAPFPAVDETYETNVDGARLHLRFDSERFVTVTDPAHPGSDVVQMPATHIRPGVVMIAWQQPDNTTVVHVDDFESGTAHVALVQPDGALLLKDGTLRPLRQ